jgi:hypothetical protein
MKNHSIVMRTTTLFPSKLAALGAAVLVTGAFALLVGAFTDKAMAQNPSGGNSDSSFAVGGFTTMVTGQHVAFAAQSNPKKPGTYAGHVVQEFIDGTSNSGPVTCLSVSGNFAVISFAVKNGQGPYRTFVVEDNGEPTMQMSMDTYRDCGLSNGDCSGNCPAPENVLRGNIVVSP